MRYYDYKTYVPTNPEAWGSEVSAAEAEILAGRLADLLRAEFPDLYVSPSRDGVPTIGPDPEICAEIDSASDRLFLTACACGPEEISRRGTAVLLDYDGRLLVRTPDGDRVVSEADIHATAAQTGAPAKTVCDLAGWEYHDGWRITAVDAKTGEAQHSAEVLGEAAHRGYDTFLEARRVRDDLERDEERACAELGLESVRVLFSVE